MGTMLEVRGLWAGYTDFVVRDLSFSVAGGELVGILGRNGSGKMVVFHGCNLRSLYARGRGPSGNNAGNTLAPGSRARVWFHPLRGESIQYFYTFCQYVFG